MDSFLENEYPDFLPITNSSQPQENIVVGAPTGIVANPNIGDKILSPSQRAFMIAKMRFDATASGAEEEVVNKIRDIINLIGKNIREWDVAQLATSEERLSRYSSTLGECYAALDTEAEYISAYVKDSMAKEYASTKEQLKQVNGKVTVGEIESSIRAKYWDDYSREILLHGRAKQFRAILEAIDRVLLATTHRIRDLERQWNINKNPRT